MKYFIVKGLVYPAKSQKHAEEIYESVLKEQELSDLTDYKKRNEISIDQYQDLVDPVFIGQTPCDEDGNYTSMWESEGKYYQIKTAL